MAMLTEGEATQWLLEAKSGEALVKRVREREQVIGAIAKARRQALAKLTNEVIKVDGGEWPIYICLADLQELDRLLADEPQPDAIVE